MDNLDILVVGAGAVGATYGHALHKGGAKVSYFVRAKYRDEVAAGLTVLPGAKRTERFVPEAVYSEPSELAGKHFDHVWLTMSSTALQGEWREPLLNAIGEAVVVLQPGLGDFDLVANHIGHDRAVSGLINYAAWEHPLEVKPTEGIAYMIPPFGKQPLSGARAQEVVESLKRGGMAAAVVEDALRQGRLGSASMNPMIASLECADWSLAKWRKTTMPLGARAAKEALAVVNDGKVPGALSLLLTPLTMSLALPVAGMMFPVDLEQYVRVHFTKVGDQTLSSLGRVLDRGREQGNPVAALEELHGLLSERRTR